MVISKSSLTVSRNMIRSISLLQKSYSSSLPMLLLQQQKQQQQYCQKVLLMNRVQSLSFSSSSAATVPVTERNSTTVAVSNSTTTSSSSVEALRLIAVLKQCIEKEESTNKNVVTNTNTYTNNNNNNNNNNKQHINDMKQLVKLLEETNITNSEENSLHNKELINDIINLKDTIQYYKKLYISSYDELFTKITCNKYSMIDEIHDLNNTNLNNNTENNNNNNKDILECGINTNNIQYTVASYGKTEAKPTVHQQEHRVIIKLHIKYIPLTQIGMDILYELVGKDRLNYTRQQLRLSSNVFGSRIENKRHCIYMLNRIILSCQQLEHDITNGTITPGTTSSPSTTSATNQIDNNINQSSQQQQQLEE